MPDKEAFIQAIKQYEAIIYRICRAYTNHSDDLKDLYQEVVYQLWKSFPNFKGLSSLGTWIYRITLNTSITYTKQKKSRDLSNRVHWDINYRQVQSANWDEEDILEMYDQIKKLNDVDKGIVLLYLDGKSHQEISDITGFGASNVGTRLHRIKNHLKTQIQNIHHGTR